MTLAPVLNKKGRHDYLIDSRVFFIIIIFFLAMASLMHEGI